MVANIGIEVSYHIPSVSCVPLLRKQSGEIEWEPENLRTTTRGGGTRENNKSFHSQIVFVRSVFRHLSFICAPSGALENKSQREPDPSGKVGPVADLGEGHGGPGPPLPYFG